jgi:hypothetical protein
VTAFTLDADAILAAITTRTRAITGIRTAYDYDEWPDAPPAIHNASAAIALTGFPGEDGTGWTYALGGPDLAIWTLRVPLYTVVADSATTPRARAWALPYVARYPEAFRMDMHLGGTITAGACSFDEEARIIRALGDDWPGYDGFYIVRHTLTVVTKGGVTNAV